MKKQINLKIVGEVQWKGYRYGSRQEAMKLGLTGYVRNLSDGSVELVAEGEQRVLKSFIAWCYTGNGLAIVHDITIRWSDPTSEFSDFLIRY